MEKYQLIDIHCHILPGVDDGAKDKEITCQMLRKMAKEGISEVIVTPHYIDRAHRHHAGKETVVELVNSYQSWLDEAGIAIRLYTGNELYYHHEIDNLLKQRKCCTLADSFYVLTEFEPNVDFAYIRSGVRELTMAGYIPVLAHVERYHAIAGNHTHLQELIEQGAYIQVNASSVEGKNGFLTKHRVLKWLREGNVHFVASDAHDLEKRPAGLQKSAEIIEKRCGKDVARRVFQNNPKSILEHRLITDMQ